MSNVTAGDDEALVNDNDASGFRVRPTVRPIEARDSAQWRELFTAYGVFYETEFSGDVVDGVWAWLMDAAHPLFCLVAELDGEVVGFAHVREQPETVTAGPGG